MGSSLLTGHVTAFTLHGRVIDDVLLSRSVGFLANVGNNAKDKSARGSISGQIASLRNLFAHANSSSHVLHPVVEGTIPLVVRANQAGKDVS